MKQIKMNYAPFVMLVVFAVLFIGAAITFAVLPSDIMNSSNAEDGQIGKIVLCAGFGVLGLVILIISFTTYRKQKNIATRINEFIAQLGDNALVFEGRIVDPKTARENAKKTAISVAIAAVCAGLFGFGVYRISGNDTRRLFVIADDGMRVIHPNTLEQVGHARAYNPKMTVTAEKHERVKAQFVDDIYYLIYTKKTDVNQEWLQNRLNELFKQETPVAPESPFEV